MKQNSLMDESETQQRPGLTEDPVLSSYLWLKSPVLIQNSFLMYNQKPAAAKMEKVIINDSKYAVLDMQDVYPFGGIQETPEEDEECLVRKKLRYQQEEDLAILNDMAAFLQNLECQYLVQLAHAEADTDGTCNFYYEYAPLTISKWILDMGEELLKQLQLELMNLASYLAKKGIKFRFDPKAVGLSRDIKIKYFLAQFAVDYENKFANFKQNEQKILEFFEELKGSEKEEDQPIDATRETFNTSSLEGSLTGIRESWDVKSWKSANSNKQIPLSKVSLIERLQQTKKKSQEVLNRLKGLKSVSSKSRE